MKRGAEKYLTDRNADEEEEDDDEVQMTGTSDGFKQAAPTELARRPIRGLPGKRSSSSTPAASPAPNGTAPRAQFSFGSPAPSTSFSFGGGSTTPATATAKPATNGFSFGAPASTSSSTPKATPSQSNVDQDAELSYYTSLRGLNLSVVPPLQRLLEKDPFVDLSEALAKILSKYKEERSAIEGKRKISTTSAPSRQSEASSKPSSTASGSMSIAQSSKLMFSFAAPSTTPSTTSPIPSAPAASAPSPAPAATKPFAGFAFGASTPASTPAATVSAPPASASEKAAPPKPFSGFSFGTSAPASSAEKKSEEPKTVAPPKPEAPKGPAPPAAPAAFSFAGNTFKPDPSKASSSSGTSSPGGGFTFNPAKAEKSEEKSSFAFPPAASPAPVQDESKLSPEPSANSKSASNGLSSSAAPFFPGANTRARQPSPLRQVETLPSEAKKAEEAAKPVSSAPKPFTGFSFGAPPPASTSAASSTPPKSFSFGSGTTATSPKATGSFGFGASGSSPKGFTSNVGFSFGSPQPTPSTTAPATSGFSFGGSSSTSAAPATTSAFGSTSSFGGSSGGFGGFSFKPSTLSSGTAFGTASGGSTPGPSTAETTPAPEDSTAPGGEEAQGPPENSLLKGGAGEENEETTYEARAKLWKNEKRKVKEGDSEVEKTEFVDHGISIVKLNRNKENGKVRMLGRSDANGRVQINFILFKDLTIKLEKSFLTFMAFEDGQPILLRLKLRNAEFAGNLKSAIEAEVAKLS